MEKTTFNDIGISSNLDWKRIRKLFCIGFFAAILVFIGDMLLGYGIEDESLSGLERSFSRYMARTDQCLFWSSLLGVIGIPLEGLCYFGIYRLIVCKSQKYAHMFRSGILGILIFGGCGVHMPCLATVYVYKHMVQVAPNQAYDIMIQFGKYFLLPGMILFFISYIVLCASQIIAFAKGYTPYPKWCLIFSMPFPMILIQLIHALVGNVPLMHGLAAAWISIGNLWMFGGLLIMMRKANS